MNLTIDSVIQHPHIDVIHRQNDSVHCTHCFRNIGEETEKTSRTKLLARHRCPERELAKQPAAPPPYN
jgi:hypothetical protein